MIRASLMRRTRRGFTLIELLVVIGIIGILATMIVAGSFRAKGGAERANTENNMQKIASALDQQIKAVVDQASTSKVSDTVLALAGNDTRRAKALWIKIHLRKEFPQTFAEARTSTNFATAPTIFNQLNGAGGLTLEEESSALLYLTLSVARRGVMFNADEAVGSTAIKNVTASNGKIFKIFVDSWGEPIRLVRVNTDTTIQAELNEEKYRGKFPYWDATDREGTLSANWIPVAPFSSTDITTMSNYLGIFLPQTKPGNNYQPYIISNGPDSKPGTGDEIYSFRMREVGQRGGE